MQHFQRVRFSVLSGRARGDRFASSNKTFDRGRAWYAVPCIVVAGRNDSRHPFSGLTFSPGNTSKRRHGMMTNSTLLKRLRATAPACIAFALLSTLAPAQTVKVEGLIKSRNGDTMALTTSDSQQLTVVLTDNTQVG